jgi:hypothetical protein
LQAGGHRFDPDRLHHILLLLRIDAVSADRADQPLWCIPHGARQLSPEMKTTVPVRRKSARLRGICPLFDIVNGFFNRCRGASWLSDAEGHNDALLQMCNLAEIIVHPDAAG